MATLVVHSFGGGKPQLSCKKVKSEISMKGDLNDPAWKKAESITLKLVDTGKKPNQKTEVRFLYSETHLYVRFDAEDSYVWGTKKERDDDIYNEECVELFISPGNSLHQYYELNVSPKNVVFDAVILNPRLVPDSKLGFKGLHAFTAEGMKTAIHIEETPDKVGGAKKWVAVMAIPFADIIGSPNQTPVSGESWLFNSFRIDAPKDKPIEYQAWQPTGKIDFHRPLFFGNLIFK